MKRNNLLKFFISVVLYMYVAPQLFAQQINGVLRDSGDHDVNISTRLLESVIVTASRKEAASFESNDAVSVITHREILAGAPRTMADVMTGVTGVWMQKTNHGGGSPFIRGLTGNQSLILIDGIRLNNATFRYGPNQYFNTLDHSSVERLEVVRGAGSVLYGSDAMGGVVNVITHSQDYQKEKPTVSGSAGLKFITQGMEQSGNADVAYRSSNLTIQGGFSYSNFGDLHAGGNLGFERPSGYDEAGFHMKSKIRLNSNWQIIVAFSSLSQQDVPRFDQVAQRGYKTYSYDPQIHRLAYAKLEHNGKNPALRHITLVFSNQISDETRKIQKLSSFLKQTERDIVSSNGMTLTIESEKGNHWSAVTGIDFYGDHVDSKKMEINSDTGEKNGLRGLYPDNSKMQHLGIFSQHTLDLGMWSLKVGGRYSISGIQIKDLEFGSVNIKTKSFVGNASMQYRAGKKNRIIVSLNSGYRAPNINDISTLGLFDYGIEIPAENLSPEQSLGVESGFKRLTNTFFMSFFIFNTRIIDQIERVPAVYLGNDTLDGQRVYKKQNTARSNITGIEAEAGVKLSGSLLLLANITGLYGQDLERAEPMRRIPPLNGKVTLQYTRAKFSGEAGFLWAAKQTRLSSGDRDDHRISAGGTPGWTVLNLQAGYSWSCVSLHGGIINLFNEAYRIHGSGVDGMGRAVWLTLQVKINS